MGYEEELRQPLDRDDWEQREVYAHFGVAVYFCQVVETALVNYLLILQHASHGETQSEAQVDELFGNTLGRNLRNVKRILGEHAEWVLAEEIAEILRLRNTLIHHWMRERVMQQGTSEKRLAMISELKDATAKLQKADRALGERTQALLMKIGVPGRFFQSEYQRLTELSESGEDDPDAPGYYSAQPIE